MNDPLRAILTDIVTTGAPANGTAPSNGLTLDDPSSPTESMLFAAMAAHDLREPLQAIQSFVSVMLRERVGPINEVQRDFLNTIYLAGRRLERLIQDIQVMITRDEGFQVIPEEVNVLAHLEACCKELEPVADGHEVRLRVSHVGRTADVIWIDPVRLDQIMLNVLENALRYSARGTDISVRLRQSRTRICVLIENQVDFPIVQNPHDWFRPFNRGGRENGTGQGGLGLGLAVVAHLVERHGGHIVARLRGSVVTIGFVLPAHGAFRREPAHL